MDTFLTSFEELARAEGQREMAVQMALRQLHRKVGPLSEELQARVSVLASERLLALSDALLDFTAQADLIVWLDAQDESHQA